MLLGVVLLYVGAVLIVNGIWLVGQARAAEFEAAPAARGAAAGNTASIWLGISWFAWAALWFLFFLLLALQRPVGKLAGWLAIVDGIATAWIFGFLILEGTVK